MTDTNLTVVIPHYNDVERLARCLDALMPQVTPQVEVIVADNASTQDLGDIKRRWPEVVFVTQPIKGAGPARNAGANAATGRWLAFLDADCVPSERWVSAAQSVATKGMVFGGKVRLFDETPPPRSGAEAFETVFAFRVRAYLAKGFLPSCQLVMARSEFATVGEFRPEVSEDVDWSHRATAAGLKLALSDELEVAHPSRQDWPALRKKWQRLTSEGYLSDVQDTGSRAKWAAKALMMPLSVMVHAPRILRHGDLTRREKWAALNTLAKLRLCRMGWMLTQALTARA